MRNETISVGDLHQSASLRDLAAALTAVREELVQVATSPQAQAEIRHEISEIQQELTEAHPRGGVVRSRWGRVATVLGPVATTSGAVAQITELITKLCAAS